MIIIAIPVWNNLAFTRIAVESIKRNSGGHHIEFAFVDNGSTDGAYEYLKSQNPKIMVRNAKNLGVTKAWNQLLEESLRHNPDVIALLNSDILVCPGWLDPVAKECAKKDMRYFQGRSSISRPNGSTFRHMPLGDSSALQKSINEIESDGRRMAQELRGQFSTGGQGWSYFFRPEVVRAFYPIPEQFELWYNDNFIYKKLKEAGYAQTVLMDCCIVHWGSGSVCNYSGFNVQVAKDKEEWIRLFGPFSYAEYVTPGGVDYFIKESKKSENFARIINGVDVKPIHVFLSYIAEYKSGVCLSFTSDQMAISSIVSGLKVRNDPKGWALNIGKTDFQFGKFTNFHSTPTDGNVVNMVKGKTGELNQKINLFYLDKEYTHLTNTIIDCYKEAFSDNIIIVTNGGHHHVVNFKPYTNPNQVIDNPSWYSKQVDGLHHGFTGVSIGNKNDFFGWKPSSGT